MLAALVHWLDGGSSEYLDAHALTGDPTVQVSFQDEETRQEPLAYLFRPAVLARLAEIFGQEEAERRLARFESSVAGARADIARAKSCTPLGNESHPCNPAITEAGCS